MVRSLFKTLQNITETSNAMDRLRFATPQKIEGGVVYNSLGKPLGKLEDRDDEVFFPLEKLNGSRASVNTKAICAKAFNDLLLGKVEDDTTDDTTDDTSDDNADVDFMTKDELLFVTKGNKFFTKLITNQKDIETATFIANLMGLPEDDQLELVRARGGKSAYKKAKKNMKKYLKSL